MQQRLKITLFVFLFALLWLPFIQEQTKIFNEPKLTGAFVTPAKPNFSIDSLNELSFQKQYENYKNCCFGFKGLLVKIKNSVNYILFKELSFWEFIVGKDGFVFNETHIKRTLGIYYNGKEKNNATIEKIKFFKDGLKNNGGKLICLLVPSKEIETLDFLPSQYSNYPKKQTDYDDLVAGLKKNNIETVDCYQYFKQFKITSPYPFYTKTGSHWSMYGASFAHDTLINYIEKTIGKSMPKYKRVGVEISDTARGDDADFERPLNLLFSIGQAQYKYPKFEMIESTRKNYRPKVIIIGDSFIRQIIGQGVLQYIFSEDSKFWYYFASTSYSINDANNCPLNNLNITKELEEADFVILEASFGTFELFPFGVTDYYFNHATSPEISKVVKQYIKESSLSMTKRNEKKTSPNLSIDEIVTTEAKHICRDKKMFTLKAANGKVVSAGGDGDKALIVNRDIAADWERFFMLQFENDKVAIYSYKNTFLSVELNSKTEITSTKKNIGDWEIFTLQNLGNGSVAFKAGNGKYVSLDKQQQQLFATADKIGTNEKFEITIVK
jgi:hypothetical protein